MAKVYPRAFQALGLPSMRSIQSCSTWVQTRPSAGAFTQWTGTWSAVASWHACRPAAYLQTSTSFGIRWLMFSHGGRLTGSTRPS
jgi:hypothetical protein